MKITIHRGINQIGGCITEISTSTSRILIDLGQNLPAGDGIVVDNLANEEAIDKLTKGIDAIFYTHYHGDHLELFSYVPDSVTQYLGKVAKQVVIRKHRQLSYIRGREEQSFKEIDKLERMRDLVADQSVVIGDIKVTPYFVSHSAYDAFMFVIEANGKRILHTGDFRGHGYLSKGLLPSIRKYVLSRGKVDFLITEGTMLSRIGEKIMKESQLQCQAKRIMKQYKNVFVMCSSTDMERLSSFYSANKSFNNRPIVSDLYQKDLLNIFSNSASLHSPMFSFDGIDEFSFSNRELMDKMEDRGFCMFVRATEKFKNYYQSLVSRLNPKETVIIYSMWKEYVNYGGKHEIPRYVDFISMFPNIEMLHTSGHATTECLAEVCNLVNPTLGIIPIHSENSANYLNLPIDNRLLSKILISSKDIEGIAVKINQNN